MELDARKTRIYAYLVKSGARLITAVPVAYQEAVTTLLGT
jgi:hypothetical protein